MKINIRLWYFVEREQWFPLYVISLTFNTILQTIKWLNQKNTVLFKKIILKNKTLINVVICRRRLLTEEVDM